MEHGLDFICATEPNDLLPDEQVFDLLDTEFNPNMKQNLGLPRRATPRGLNSARISFKQKTGIQ